MLRWNNTLLQNGRTLIETTFRFSKRILSTAICNFPYSRDDKVSSLWSLLSEFKSRRGFLCYLLNLIFLIFIFYPKNAKFSLIWHYVQFIYHYILHNQIAYCEFGWFFPGVLFPINVYLYQKPKYGNLFLTSPWLFVKSVIYFWLLEVSIDQKTCLNWILSVSIQLCFIQ